MACPTRGGARKIAYDNTGITWMQNLVKPMVYSDFCSGGLEQKSLKSLVYRLFWKGKHIPHVQTLIKHAVS